MHHIHNFTYSLISFHSVPCYVSWPIQNLKYIVLQKSFKYSEISKQAPVASGQSRSDLIVVQVKVRARSRISLQQWPTRKLRSLSDTQRKPVAPNLSSQHGTAAKHAGARYTNRRGGDDPLHPTCRFHGQGLHYKSHPRQPGSTCQQGLHYVTSIMAWAYALLHRLLHCPPAFFLNPICVYELWRRKSKLQLS
jgi:hypothetical protein